MLMDLGRIRIDGNTQSRVALNESVVAEYATALEDGTKLPPVTVFFDGTDHWLADGFHRFFAHKKASKGELSVDLKEGTKRDARFFSCGANGTHGLRRTNDDKRKAVLDLLLDAEWSQMSDRAISRHCAVTHPFVASLRASLVVTVTTPDPVDNLPMKQEIPTGQVPPPEQEPEPEVAEDDDVEHAISMLSQENEELRARLSVGVMVGTDEEKKEAADTIAHLRNQVKTLAAENSALRASRDHYQREASELRKQIKMNEKELKRARATA